KRCGGGRKETSIALHRRCRRARDSTATCSRGSCGSNDGHVERTVSPHAVQKVKRRRDRVELQVSRGKFGDLVRRYRGGPDDNASPGPRGSKNLLPLFA